MRHVSHRQLLAFTAALGAPGAALSPTRQTRGLGLLGLVTATLVTLAAVTAQGQERADFEAAGVLYTADERGNSISAVNLASDRVEIVPVLVAPHNVQITADGTRLLAVGTSAADRHGHDEGGAPHDGGETAGRLLTFDARNPSAGPIMEIAVGKHPAHVIAAQQGRRAFVTNAGDDTISVVDLDRNEVVGTIATGDYPHGLRMSPDGREIYVANVQDGSVSVIDTARLHETARIPVGKAPVQVGFTPDGRRAYVSLRDESRVAVIDTASRTVIDRIEVGRNPIQVHATPDGRFVYVANQGTEADPADTVSVIEAATGSVIDTIRTGNGAHGVAVSEDGAFVFVTNKVDGTVSAIDTASREVVATVPVGPGPNGITVRPGTAAAEDHDAHHPAQAQSEPAPVPALPGTSSAAGMAGDRPEMMGMMTPEMMQRMQGTMRKQGGEGGHPGMMTCSMMGDMMARPSGGDPQAVTGEADLGPAALYGLPQASPEEMTPERVRAWLERRLAWHGNSRLKIGKIAAAGEGTVTAEIVTIDGSLVQKLAFNRYPGLVRQITEWYLGAERSPAPCRRRARRVTLWCSLFLSAASGSPCCGATSWRWRSAISCGSSRTCRSTPFGRPAPWARSRSPHSTAPAATS
jgi:YVTN family beta-propeller protein